MFSSCGALAPSAGLAGRPHIPERQGVEIAFSQSTTKNSVRLAFLLPFALLAAAATTPASAATTYPAGFYEEPAIVLRRQTTSIVPVRRDIFLLAEKPGTVVVAVRGRLVRILLTVPVNNDLERGLLGLALEPGFRTRGYLYVYYTVAGPAPMNRVSRFFIDGKNGAGAEEIVLDGIPSDSGIHNGGCLRFGPDGLLYVGVGDGGMNPSGAADLSRLAGKILRIAPDGSTPAGNPFVGLPGARGEVYAYGVRNPYRFSFDPAAPGRLFANDVGNRTWEEVNRIVAGANYGWPANEGPGAIDGSAEPIAWYANMGGAAVTGSAFYRGATYPPELFGSYFYTDFVTGVMQRLELDLDGAVVANETFATGLSSPIDLVQAPDGDFYYISYNAKTVYRIRYVGEGNRPPSLTATASPDGGRAPLLVTFKMGGSYDPDGDPLKFHFDFDDGETVDTGGFLVTHLFTQLKPHDVAITVRDGRGGSAGKTILIRADNDYPVPVIGAPPDRREYACGDVVSFSGSATDTEDGALASQALSWNISFQHADHAHPFLGPLDGVTGGQFTIPRTGETATDVAYKIQLRATDSGGLTAKTKVFLVPRTTTITLRSSPSGLSIHVAGTPRLAPTVVDSVVGYEWTISVPTPQVGGDGRTYDFFEWADTATADNPRLLRAPGEPSDFLAIFLPR